MKKVNPTIMGHNLGEPYTFVHGLPVWRTDSGYVCPPGGHSDSPREAVKAFLACRRWKVGHFVLYKFSDATTALHYGCGVGTSVAVWPTFPTRRQIANAIRERRLRYPLVRWQCGPFTLLRKRNRWLLESTMNSHIAIEYDRRPSRREIATWVKEVRATERASRLDPTAPDTLGWRTWFWNGTVLVSPYHYAEWRTSCLQARTWSTSDAVEGKAGIHAYRMVRDWRRALAPSTRQENEVVGVVERFGRAVVGPVGWRAEFVVIRKLLAPTPEIAVALAERYPDVEILVR